MVKQGENLFMKNYEFPCVRAWGESPVHVSTHLKNHFSFKNKYSITSTGLIGHRYSLTTTKDDSVFPRLQWLITAFNVNSYLLCVI